MFYMIFNTALLNPRRIQRRPNLRGLSWKANKISRKPVPRETGFSINTPKDWQIWQS